MCGQEWSVLSFVFKLLTLNILFSYPPAQYRLKEVWIEPKLPMKDPNGGGVDQPAIEDKSLH